MAKIERGRLAKTTNEMPTYTAAELFAWADEIEKQIQNPHNEDDPRYLQRWADKIRRLAIKKEKARIHKRRQQ